MTRFFGNFFRPPRRIETPPWVEELIYLARLDHRLLEKIMSALDDLTAQVAANKTVIDSALTLISGIADRIAAAGTDATKLAELTASLKSEDEALAAAVAANTPPAI